jgi:hypothetical protein
MAVFADDDDERSNNADKETLHLTHAASTAVASRESATVMRCGIQQDGSIRTQGSQGILHARLH